MQRHVATAPQALWGWAPSSGMWATLQPCPGCSWQCSAAASTDLVGTAFGSPCVIHPLLRTPVSTVPALLAQLAWFNAVIHLGLFAWLFISAMTCWSNILLDLHFLEPRCSTTPSRMGLRERLAPKMCSKLLGGLLHFSIISLSGGPPAQTPTITSYLYFVLLNAQQRCFSVSLQGICRLNSQGGVAEIHTPHPIY